MATFHISLIKVQLLWIYGDFMCGLLDARKCSLLQMWLTFGNGIYSLPGDRFKDYSQVIISAQYFTGKDKPW